MHSADEQPVQPVPAPGQRLIHQHPAADILQQVERDEVCRPGGCLPDQPAARGEAVLQMGEGRPAGGMIPDDQFAVHDQAGWEMVGEGPADVREEAGQGPSGPRL
jgi:hypothetical protein